MRTIIVFAVLLINTTQLWAMDRQFLLVQNRADKSSNLSLDELGFDQAQTKSNPAEQQVINERTRKLQLHQKLGLLTLGLAAAAALTAEEGEAGKEAPESHEILGFTTAASYFTTAYFSLTAPDLNESAPRKGWNMKVHRAMAFIHFPAMLLLPFAGMQANDDYKNNKSLSGLGKYKKDLAGAALASMAVAAISVAIDF